MGPTFFPPIQESPLSLEISPASAASVAIAYRIITYGSLLILLWDWAWSIRKEIDLAWNVRKRGLVGRVGRRSWREWLAPGVRATKWTFLASRKLMGKGGERYLAITQAVLYGVAFSLPSFKACDVTRYLPFGFSIVSFSVHLTMCLRMYGIGGHSTPLLVTLIALSVLDVALQLALDGLIQPVHLTISMASGSSFHACYLIPSSTIFVLAFVSPSIFHHIVLVSTCWIAWKHLAGDRRTGSNLMKKARLFDPKPNVVLPLKRVVRLQLRAAQVFYVLAVCLTNFLNVILVLQPHEPYRLINYLPSMCLTQIMLGRIYFTIRQLATTPVVGNIGLPHFTSTEDFPATRAVSPPQQKSASFLRIGGSSRPRNGVVPISPQASYRADETIDIRLPTHQTITIEMRTNHQGFEDIQSQSSRTASRVSGYEDLSFDSKQVRERDDGVHARDGSISTLVSGIEDLYSIPLKPLRGCRAAYEASTADSFDFPTPPAFLPPSHEVERLRRPSPSPVPPVPLNLQQRRQSLTTPLKISPISPLTDFPPRSPLRRPSHQPRPRRISVTTSFPPIDSKNLSPPFDLRSVRSSVGKEEDEEKLPTIIPHPYNIPNYSRRSSARTHQRSMSAPWVVPQDWASTPLPSSAVPLLHKQRGWEVIPLDFPESPGEHYPEEQVQKKASRRRAMTISPSEFKLPRPRE
ncbi:hypothetical protein P7C70_g4613, partial [Phenoliferia sp. Uapishka_3]